MKATSERASRLVAVLTAIMFLTVLTPIQVQGAVSDYWAEKDVDVRLEPHYRDISYSPDPIETVSRFDLKGTSWYIPTTSSVNDSSLILGPGASNATLNVKNDAHLNDGRYFEVRVKLNTIGNFTLTLWTADQNRTQVMLAHTGKVYGKFNETTILTSTLSLGAWTADTWIKLGIFYGAQKVVYATYDNGTELGHAAITCNMTYTDVDHVELKQSVALKTATVDYFVVTSTKTDLTPVSQASRALKMDDEEQTSRRYVDSTLDNIDDVLTLSNDTAVANAIGYTPSGIDITNDNRLNQTDLAKVITETPEDIDASFSGRAVVKGWDDVRDTTEETLDTYLADRHQVSKMYVIDYYIDDMKVNISVSEGLADKIEKSAIKDFMSISEDEGAEVSYDDDSGLREDWSDFDFAYIPRDVTSTEWAQMKEDLSNEVRKQTVSIVGLCQKRPTEVTDPMISSPFMLGSSAMALEGDLDTGPVYQETNALIGSVLAGNDYTAVDAETMDTAMSANNQTDFGVMDDGKPAESGFSLVTVFGSMLLWIIVVFVVVLSAVLVGLMLVRRHKHGKKKK